MADPTLPPREVVDDVPSSRRAVTGLLRDRVLDAELAATIWLLVEGRVSLIIASPGPSASARELVDALLDFVPAGIRRVMLAGRDERFGWLPQAGELGWHQEASSPSAATREPLAPVRPDTTILVARAFSDVRPGDTWGETARIAIRAASVGYMIAGTIEAGSLEAVLATFRRSPIRLTDDELTRLGVVLVLDEAGRHVAAAHYVRPLARDEHGHVQRLGPAVLVTHDAVSGRFEHFGWGIWPELASRVGRRAGDFEQELERRRAFLDESAAGRLDDTVVVRHAINAFLTADADASSSSAGRAASAPPSSSSTH